MTLTTPEKLTVSGYLNNISASVSVFRGLYLISKWKYANLLTHLQKQVKKKDKQNQLGK